MRHVSALLAQLVHTARVFPSFFVLFCIRKKGEEKKQLLLVFGSAALMRCLYLLQVLQVNEGDRQQQTHTKLMLVC